MTVRLVPDIATGAWADEDWGSAAPACIFSIGVCVATGKDGIAYPVKTANMGGTTPADLKLPKTNCAKLAAPPVWLTVESGPEGSVPERSKTSELFPWGDTAHLHMTPVQFFDPVLNSWTLFAWGENNQLHKWKVSSTGTLTYVANGTNLPASMFAEQPTGRDDGRLLRWIEQWGDPNSAILACTIPYWTQTRACATGGCWSTILCIWRQMDR